MGMMSICSIMYPDHYRHLSIITHLRYYFSSRPTSHNVIFHTILDDFLNISAQLPFLNHWERFSQRQEYEVEVIRDVKRWRHAWLVIIHVHVHVAADVLYDFIKLTKVNTERRSNAA